MAEKPKIAIVYLSYHCEPYFNRALLSWKNLTYPQDRFSVVVVDNPHPQHGSSVEFVKQQLEKEGIQPQTIVIPQTKNLGFAGGNNVGIDWVIKNNFDYVFLHNQDGFMSPDCLDKIAETMEADKTIGAAQSLILLYPEKDLINTSGNKFHYLGFAYCGDYRKPVCHCERSETKRSNPIVGEIAPRNDNCEISYASGAAMMLRVDLLKQHGALDCDYFAYHEDLEYCLRLRTLGYKIALSPQSVFYHEHEFSRNPDKYYFMERNRFAVMTTYLKWRTLFLFLPIELVTELGLLLFALKNGWIKQWARVYLYWLSPKNWKLWLKKRAQIQKNRQITDKEFLRYAVDKVEFEGINGPLIKLGNVLLNAYWKAIKALIRW